MVDPTEAPVPISVAVAVGAQVATSLQICLEVSWAARRSLKEITPTVSATAAVLGQLQDVLYPNQGNDGHPRIFKEEGLIEVNCLAKKCHLLFKIIIALVQASAGDINNGKESDVNPDTPSIREKAIDPALGSSTLMANMASKIDDDWLEPRIERCCVELHYLRMTVLLHLQIAKLAKLYDGGLRDPGTFDQELCFRTTAVKLRQRQVKLAKKEKRSQMKEASKWAASDAGSDSDSDSGAGTPPVRAASNTGDVEVDNPKPVSPANEPAEENAHTPSPSDLQPAAALTSQTPTMAPGESSPSAPAYSAHTPVGHHAMECAVTSANLSSPAEKTPLEGPGNLQASHDLKPLIPEKPADDAPVTQSTRQESSSSITTAAAALDSVPITALFRPTLSQRLGSWFGRMFGSRASKKEKLNCLLMDEGSHVLEAYLVGSSRGRGCEPIKLPLGHEQLKNGLARTLRATNKGEPSSSSSPWPTLHNLSVFERGMVDNVVKFASRASRHQRTCVAIQECKTEGQLPSYLLFFSLAEPLPAVQFKDAVGRKFGFPYELCREWKDMEALIKAAFLHVEIIGPHVMEGHYDLMQDGEIILPSLWSTTVVPGASVVMHMWPMPPQPPRFPPPPGFGMPMGPQPMMGPRPGMPPPPAPPPNMFIRPMMMPGGRPFPVIIDVGPPTKTKEERALEADLRDIRVVDFVEEAKLDDLGGVADMIRRFTYIVDAEFTPFELESDDDIRYCNSDSDSDASSYI